MYCNKPSVNALLKTRCEVQSAMGKKDKLSRDPVSQHRKDEKKKLAAKMKKERTERKEAKFQTDPRALQLEIDKLRSTADLRQAGGSTAKMEAKIEELIAVKAESERRRAAEGLDEDAAPAQSEVTLDLSAITGVKRKARAPAPAPARAASSAPAGMTSAEAAAEAAAMGAGPSSFAPPYAAAAAAATAAAAAVTSAVAAAAAGASGAVAASGAAAVAPAALGRTGAVPSAVAGAVPGAAPSAVPGAQLGTVQGPGAWTQALPEGWRQTAAPDGRTYYYHAATKATSWKRPGARRPPRRHSPRFPAARLKAPCAPK